MPAWIAAGGRHVLHERAHGPHPQAHELLYRMQTARSAGDILAGDGKPKEAGGRREGRSEGGGGREGGTGP
eukprot:762969-Hanusia_phi.AAC.8